MPVKEPAMILPGKYVIAVSGGVDSVVLLDMLYKKDGVELVVAHFDHGIRPDSAEDGEFVRHLAEKYSCNFELEQGNLGEKASEAEARRARYDFLRQVQEKHSAIGIITAHHQDDVIETSAINLLRGTGRRGLDALRSYQHLPRPFLHLTKSDILEYARAHNLQWREDSTNLSSDYLRNRLRNKVLPKGSEQWRRNMLDRIEKAAELNQRIDRELDELLRYKFAKGSMALSRSWFVHLPHAVAGEVVVALLRRLKVADMDAKLVERIIVAVKTAKPGKKVDIDKDHYILLTKRSARVMNRTTNKTARV